MPWGEVAKVRHVMLANGWMVSAMGQQPSSRAILREQQMMRCSCHWETRLSVKGQIKCIIPWILIAFMKSLFSSKLTACHCKMTEKEDDPASFLGPVPCLSSGVSGSLLVSWRVRSMETEAGKVDI